MKLFSFVFFLVLGIVLGISQAQAADDDLIILDEDSAPQTQTSPTLDFLQRHFHIIGGGFWSGGSGSFQQILGFGSASFDYPFDFLSRKGRLLVSGGYSYRQVELSLTFGENFQDATSQRRQELQNPENDDSECRFAPVDVRGLSDEGVRNVRRSCEFDVKVTDSSGELREAFFEYEIRSDLVVAVGRQRPAWGQFDVFSVTNALLPIEFQSREFGFSNNNLRYPQDAVIVSYFPTERVELSGYLFFQTSLDPILEKGLIGGSYNIFVEGEPSSDNPNFRGRENFISCDTREGVSECEFPFSGDLEGEDKLGYAGRALWRLDDFTLGFTFNQGRFSLLNLFNRLPMVERFCLSDTDCGDERNVIGYNVTDRLILGEATAFAGEFSVPINEWTIKGEFVYVQGQSDIGLFTQRRISICPNDPNNPFFAECQRSLQRQDDLFNWISDMNGGRGYVDVDAIMVQLGFDARYDRWNFGLSLLLFQTLLSDEADRANALYKAAFPGSDSVLDESDFGGIPLPTAYVFYDFGAEQQHTLGFAGGFLGVVAGVSVFYTGSKLLNEHLNWTVSVDYTTSIANQLIADSNENRQQGGDSELSDDFSLSFRVGATLEF